MNVTILVHIVVNPHSSVSDDVFIVLWSAHAATQKRRPDARAAKPSVAAVRPRNAYGRPGQALNVSSSDELPAMVFMPPRKDAKKRVYNMHTYAFT